MNELLAKSRHRELGTLSLSRHCHDTERAAQALFRLDTRWGHNFSRFFGITDPAERARLLLNLRVAGLFHDIGKANEDFQTAISDTGTFFPQVLRHEHLSALILCLDPVRAWLQHNPALDVDAITAAVLSHHLKASDTREEYKWCQPRTARPALELYLDHADIAEIFERVRHIADLPSPPALPTRRWSERDSLWHATWRNGQLRHARQLKRTIKRDRARLGFVLAVKAGVIAADSAASGLFRTNQSIEQWIDRAAHCESLTAEKLDRDIIEKRCAQLSRDPDRPFALRPFQRRAAELGSRALLLAGCGSGKTLAAWKWAQAQLAAHELGHVVFLYPTRGTATEGFRDYVAWAPETDATLLHGTSEYELDGMYQNPSEAIGDKRFEPGELESRLYALGLWPRRYFSATVDQFFAFLEHRYESLCLLPLLADSAVILDEVHSYDSSMFADLIAFLKHFDVPVLCMTATLPPDRREALRDAGLRVYPDDDERAELRELEAAETHLRYRITALDRDQRDVAFDHAIAGYRDGQRVLWVVNTVARCQDLAERLGRALGHTVLVYHSRFRLMDRQDKHAATVAAFQQRTAPAIAVTTQVCEMSLDLDADVLITEAAPISSLVQRLGRANRHAARGLAFRAAVYIYPPDNALPYQIADLQTAAAFLAEIGAGDVSQRTLAEALRKHARREPAPDGSASFLRGGYFATPGSFREEDAFSVQAVLDSDIETLAPYASDRPALRRRLPGYLLSVPRKSVAADAEPPEWLPSYLRVAPGQRYDTALGFLTGDQP